MFCGYGSGLVRLTRQFELPSDTPAHGCLDAHDVKSVQGINHLVCLESPRWHVEM